jgi:peptide-methionine (S)-S-oxide reductase
MKDIAMKSILALGVAGLAAAFFLAGPGVAEKAVSIPLPPTDQYPENRTDVAVLAGGCFWGMEGVFEHVKGVTSVTSGYAGGGSVDATYDQVSSEATRHAEAIRITYNPTQVTFGTLLRVYFSVAHDPTQLNRQGPDSGTSYRSAIFVQDKTQANIARAYIASLTKAHSYPRAIVTKIETGRFYPAEAYHQDFMRRNPGHPYIQHWDVPKLAAYKAAFPQLWK